MKPQQSTWQDEPAKTTPLNAVRLNYEQVRTQELLEGVENASLFPFSTSRLVPTGGEAGKVLGWKASGEAKWENVPGGLPAGGEAGQVLGWKGSAEGEWVTSAGVSWEFVYSGAEENLLQGAHPTITIGKHNTSLGVGALAALTGGEGNTAVGAKAGATVKTGGFTAVGYKAFEKATGTAGAAFGFEAGAAVTLAEHNTLVGSKAGISLNTGSFNVLDGSKTGVLMTSGEKNVGVGFEALAAMTTTSFNTAVGYRAGVSAVGETGTYLGHEAGTAVTSGNGITAVGAFAGKTTKTGLVTAVGFKALEKATGSGNTAVGLEAGVAAEAVEGITAVGHKAALTTKTGIVTAVGFKALEKTTVANTAVGLEAGLAVTTGEANTLLGAKAGVAVTTAQEVVAIGPGALAAVTTHIAGVHDGHVAVGSNALLKLKATVSPEYGNTAVGWKAAENLVKGASCTFIGADAGPGGNVNTNRARQETYTYQSCVAIGENSLTEGKEAAENATLNGMTALGDLALNLCTASLNTAAGWEAGTKITTGEGNTVVGFASGKEIQTGTNNTAVGREALKGAAATTASELTAVGYLAMSANTTGLKNTAVGAHALQANKTQSGNTAVGFEAGREVTGKQLTVIGALACTAASAGTGHTLIGYKAGEVIGSASEATIIGNEAGQLMTGGTGSVVIGAQALKTLTASGENVAIGYKAGAEMTNVASHGNIFIGYQAGIKANGEEGESNNQLVIGKNSTGLISGITGPSVEEERLGFFGTEPYKAGKQQTITGNATQEPEAVVGQLIRALGGHNLVKNETTSGIFNLPKLWSEVAVPSEAKPGNLFIGSAPPLIVGTEETEEGWHNTALGFAAAGKMTTGRGNVAVGVKALAANTIGVKNTAVGFSAGAENIEAEGSVYIGYEAGKNAASNNVLYIANSNTTTPLILGTFPNATLKFNAEEMGFFKHGLTKQPKTTGTKAGFTIKNYAATEAGLKEVLENSTFKAAGSGTAYTISDIVLALKNTGLMAE